MTSLERPDRATRVARVTAGLSAIGGVVGALCAGSSVAIIALVTEGFSLSKMATALDIIGLSAAAGALVGIVGAPLMGFGLLRRVPIGRIILVTALGTIVGALAGEWLRPFNPYFHTIPSVIVGALVGFVLSGIALRLLAQRETTSALRSHGEPQR